MRLEQEINGSAITALFKDALRKVGVQNLSTKIGVSKNAIYRWLDTNNIPWQYEGDFKRILGREGFIDVTGNPVRDRDQFYTRRFVAKHCCQTFRKVTKQLKVDLDKKHWIEPSAGCGWFFLEFPESNRTGIDIDPKGVAKKQILKKDFLLWTPPPFQHGCVVLGNPPFGIRGHLALQFINHSAKFADMIGFIVPQLFNSDGKGVASKRVTKHLSLAYSEPLSSDSFETPMGEPVQVQAIFQIWTAVNKEKIKQKTTPTCDSWISVYSLSDGGTPATTRNKSKIGKCDFYLPSTCFNGMRAFRRFEDLPHQRGYGIVIHKQKKRVKELMTNLNWNEIAFKSTNGAVNLRKSLIQIPLIEAGYHD